MNIFRRKRLTSVLFVVFVFILILYSKQNLVRHGVLETAKLIIDGVVGDSDRRQTNMALIAKSEWDHHQLQIQFMEKICESKGVNRKDYLWLTAFVNDEYALPAIVLGHSIRTLSCIKNMLVLTSDEVSLETKQSLTKVGWTVEVVTAMDCHWMERKLGYEPRSNGIIGTYTRFHAFNYTQYTKIIYMDPDYMLLTNIDELFEMKADFAAAYCSRPGLVDPCFNAGLMVFRPNTQDYNSIMDLWETLSRQSCPSDQELLWFHYAHNGRWSPLSFAYNVRRMIHYPMKAFHFVCCPPQKPWKGKCRPSRNEARSFNQGITNLRDISLVFWKKFYNALKTYHIDEWWRSTKYFMAEIEFGKHLYNDCWPE